MPFGTDFLVGLSREAKISVLRGVMPDLFRQGYSATGALNLLREYGPVLRKQDFLAHWREMTGIEKQSQAFRFAPKKYRISAQLMTPTADPFGRDYKYLFRWKDIDPNTGLTTSKWVSFLSDDRMSIEEAEAIMEQELFDVAEDTESGVSYAATPATLELFGVYRSS